MFSVIVPMYNVEQFANRCIESILGQTFKDFELILVNDGSRDTTLQIIKKYAEIDKRIVVVDKINGGLVSARKAGLEISRGDYIVPVDGDDWISNDYLEKFNSAILESNADIVCCEHYLANENEITESKVKHSYYGLMDKEYLMQNVYTDIFSIVPTVWGKVFKRSLIFDHQMRVDNIISMGEDGAVTIPCFYYANSVHVLPDRLYYYRFNPNSITKNKKKEINPDGLIARITLLDAILPSNEFYFDEQIAAYVIHSVFNVILSYFRNNNYSIAREKSMKLLDNGLINRYLGKKARYRMKAEKLAAFSMKNRFFWLIKLYSIIR